MRRSSPPPPRDPLRGSTIGPADYKLFMADLSQVCDGRTLAPTPEEDARFRGASFEDYHRPARAAKTSRPLDGPPPKGSRSKERAAPARPARAAKTSSPFDDEPSKGLQGKERVEPACDASISTRSTASSTTLPAGSQHPGKAPRRSSCPSLSFDDEPSKCLRGKEGSGGGASVSTRSTASATALSAGSWDTGTKSLQGKERSSGDASVSTRSTASSKTASAGSRDARRASRRSSCPPGTSVLRRKYRPRHHSAALNESITGIRRPSRYSQNADDGAGAAPPLLRRASMPARRPGTKDGEGDWVALGVEFNPHMEVYIF